MNRLLYLLAAVLLCCCTAEKEEIRYVKLPHLDVFNKNTSREGRLWAFSCRFAAAEGEAETAFFKDSILPFVQDLRAEHFALVAGDIAWQPIDLLREADGHIHTQFVYNYFFDMPAADAEKIAASDYAIRFRHPQLAPAGILFSNTSNPNIQ